MRILLITAVYKNDVVGPARFARLLESSPLIDVDILTSNVKETTTLKSVNIEYKWWQKKLKVFFSIAHFCRRIFELKDNYDVLLFNSSILVDHRNISTPFIVMVNDEKLASLKFSFSFDYFRRSIHRRVEKRAVQNASKIIVNSSYLKSKIASAYSVDSSKISVLLKGISLDNKILGFWDSISTSEKDAQVLFVKNDYKLGGLLDLIEALGQLKRTSFYLTIIGTDEGVKAYLVNYSNIRYNVLGYKTNDEVIQEMYNQDLLCIPSRFEPLGVAIMEGLAVGIPTITTGVGGLPEVTENGKHVWQCEPYNPQSIAEQIALCISNPALRKAKSESGKKYVHDKFDFKDVVSRLKDIISAPHTIP